MNIRCLLLANIFIASTGHAQTPSTPLFSKNELMSVEKQSTTITPSTLLFFKKELMSAEKQSTTITESAAHQFCKNLRAQVNGNYPCTDASMALFQSTSLTTDHREKNRYHELLSNSDQNIWHEKSGEEKQKHSATNNFWLDGYHHYYAWQLALKLARESNTTKIENYFSPNYINNYHQPFLLRNQNAR